MKSFFVAITLVITCFIGLETYNQKVSAGEPSISHSASAESWGATGSTSVGLGSPWTEGETYTGHGSVTVGIAVEWHGMNPEDPYFYGGYDDGENRVEVKTFIDFLGIKILYLSTDSPSAYAYPLDWDERVTEASAYVSGWLYMLSPDPESDTWPD